MKYLSTLFLAVVCFISSNIQAQCSATIGYQSNPNALNDSFWVENFTGDSSHTTFSWLFCDGSTVLGMNILHANTSGGVPLTNCLVCLTFADSTNGCTFTVCDTVNVTTNPNNACAVYASFTNQDSLYTFFANHTGSTPVVYEWKVNGTVVDTTAQFSMVIDSFHFPNAASVCVGIIDATGCVSTDCVNVGTGGNPNGGTVPCQAYFVILPDTGINSGGNPGDYIGFNYSSGNFGADILWDFGDGTTSADPYPVHTYSTPGNYVVCLSVGVAGTGCYDTYCDSSFYAFKTESNPMSHLSISAATGIKELAAASIHLFPNPVSSELNITGYQKFELIRVFDVKGQQVFEAKNMSGKINLSKLTAGMYFLELNTGKGILRSKFLKN